VQELQERIQSSSSAAAEMEGRVRREVVDLHGEMVLLLNYSSINYTGLAKILKKYDKRTGGVLRLPVIVGVLAPAPALLRRRPPLRAAAEQTIFCNTVAALLTMQEVRSGSSTSPSRR
jgi:hypothetical protein